MVALGEDDFRHPLEMLARGRGRGRGRGAARPNATARKQCLVPGCENMVVNQKVWCGPHSNSWTGLLTQKVEQGPEVEAKVNALYAPGREVERGEAAGAYAKRNPPDKTYAKKQLFDLLNYMKVCFAATQSVDHDEDKPRRVRFLISTASESMA